MDATAQEALAFTVAFLETSPDDDTLCSAALTIGEPLIDLHWQEITTELLDLLRTRSEMRKMVSCCDLDDSVPLELRQQIYSFVEPHEDIGSRPARPPQNAPLDRGLRKTAPRLVDHINSRSPETVATIVRTACENAVRATGLVSPAVEAALVLLAHRIRHAPSPELMDELSTLRSSLMAGGPPRLTLAGEETAEDRYAHLRSRQALAVKAVAYAVGRTTHDATERALFAAGFAIGDPATVWESLLSFNDGGQPDAED
jgi:hypothetical protein